MLVLDYRLVAYRKKYEESPGNKGKWQSLTATGSDPRESATETKPPGLLGKDETSEVKAHSVVR
jgi:hypothetical protein